MAIQLINVGSAPNDGTGDTPRAAGQKLNSNFSDPSHAASKLASSEATANTVALRDANGTFKVGEATDPAHPYRIGDLVADKSSFDVYGRDNIVGTVSQSGGVPTGAIIERGSNANGEYVRFADGTQITISNMQSVTVTSGPSGGFYFFRMEDTYAAVFSQSPQYYLNISKSTYDPAPVNRIRWFYERAEGAIETIARNTFISTDQSDSVEYYVVAIGRWY